MLKKESESQQSATYDVMHEECFGKQFSNNERYPRSLCSSNENGNPCAGMSGENYFFIRKLSKIITSISGFGFYVEFDGKWTLEGIQSHAYGNCSENGYTTYTMISEYTFWLKYTIDGFI